MAGSLLKMVTVFKIEIKSVNLSEYLIIYFRFPMPPKQKVGSTSKNQVVALRASASGCHGYQYIILHILHLSGLAHRSGLWHLTLAHSIVLRICLLKALVFSMTLWQQKTQPFHLITLAIWQIYAKLFQHQI